MYENKKKNEWFNLPWEGGVIDYIKKSTKFVIFFMKSKVINEIKWRKAYSNSWGPGEGGSMNFILFNWMKTVIFLGNWKL